MRFVIQSSIYVVIVAILLHAALAIPLPGPPGPPLPGKPGFLNDKQLAAQEKVHKMQAAWHGHKAASSYDDWENKLRKAGEEPLFKSKGKYYAAAAKAKDRAEHHTDRQQEHLELQKECRKKREGKPA
jgi:hypothetical protein